MKITNLHKHEIVDRSLLMIPIITKLYIKHDKKSHTTESKNWQNEKISNLG